MVLPRLYASACIHAPIQPVLLYWVAACYRERPSFDGFIPFVETSRGLPRDSGRHRSSRWKISLPSTDPRRATDRPPPRPRRESTRPNRSTNGSSLGIRDTGVTPLPSTRTHRQRARQNATSYFDKSRGSLLITGAHCDIQPRGIQGFNIIDTRQRSRHPRPLKESLSIGRRTLLLYPPVKRSKLGGSPYNLPGAVSPPPGEGFFMRRSSCLRSIRNHRRCLGELRPWYDLYARYANYTG